MKDNIDRKKYHSIIMFAIIFSILMAVSTAVTLYYQNSSRNQILDTFKMISENQIDIQQEILHSSLEHVKSDLLFLPNLNEVLSYKEFENENEIKQIENEYLEFAKSSGNYDQIRYIDSSGLELIRINYNNGHPAAAPEEELQNKSSRYYFTETISIPEANIYISPFDLNIEQGQIEIPLKPMIRFSTPVYDKNGMAKGIVILNYLGEQLIDNLRTAKETHPGTYSLLNADGYWLYNNDKEKEWGFMYPEKQDVKLSKTDPELWNKLLAAEHSQILTDQALYTAEHIYIGQDDQCFKSSKLYILLNTVTNREMNIDKEYLSSKLRNIIFILIIINSIISVFLSIILLERRYYRQALKESALYDPLTKLPNRNLLEERLTRISGNAKRYEDTYAVMFIDLDGFKSVNDTFGHDTGDRLLQEVASILNSCIRETDTAARFGGDEFIILLSVIKSIEDCKIVAEKILSKISEDIIIDGNVIKIGGSIGIAAIKPDCRIKPEEIVHFADEAMYEVKKSGKNSYRIVTI